MMYFSLTLSNIKFIAVIWQSTSGYLNISINEGLELDGVTIYNALGQKVSQTKGTTQIDVSHIPSGIYYLSISTDQGTVTKTMVRR